MSLISSIFEGLSSGLFRPFADMFNKKQDANIEKFKIDGQVDITLINAHIALAQSQNDLRKTSAVQVLILLFGLPLAFYYGKVLVWDAALHLGYTDAIHGDVALWNKMVVTFLFGASALQAWRR
jgi:hypothetical protein